MQLTQQQINFFNAFGYLKLPGAFKDDIEKISAAFDQAFIEHKKDLFNWDNQAHEFKPRTTLPYFIDRSEYLCSLIDDPRISGIFSSLCGDDFNYLGSDANIFECGTRWHSDNYGSLSKYLNVKIIFYLEKLDENSGALRVIPGSHNYGDTFSNTLTKHLMKADCFEEALGLKDEDIPAQVINTDPGDIIVFDYRLKHATCYRGNIRRMFALVSSERMADNDLEAFRARLKMSADLGYLTYYSEMMLNNATPERMKHLEQLKDLDLVSLLETEKEDQFTQQLIDQGLKS